MKKEDKFPIEKLLMSNSHFLGVKLMDTNLLRICQSPYFLHKTDKTPMVFHKDDKDICVEKGCNS